MASRLSDFRNSETTNAALQPTDFVVIVTGSGPYVDQGLPFSEIDKRYVSANRTNAVVDVATLANITLSGEQTIDGVTTSASRVLVCNQSTPSQNGIYTSGSGAWTRTNDFSAWSQFPGVEIFVYGGNQFGLKKFVCLVPKTGTIGTTAINFGMVLTTVTANGAAGSPAPLQLALPNLCIQPPPGLNASGSVARLDLCGQGPTGGSTGISHDSQFRMWKGDGVSSYIQTISMNADLGTRLDMYVANTGTLAVNHGIATDGTGDLWIGGCVQLNPYVGTSNPFGNEPDTCGTSFAIYTGSGGDTWTLYSPGSAPGGAHAGGTVAGFSSPGGQMIWIKNRGSGNLTVASSAGSQIYTTSAQANVTVAPGGSLRLGNCGTYWEVL